METFSIVDKINVDKLNTKIAEFVYKEGHEPYIFANKETLDTLIKPIEQVLRPRLNVVLLVNIGVIKCLKITH